MRKPLSIFVNNPCWEVPEPLGGHPQVLDKYLREAKNAYRDHPDAGVIKVLVPFTWLSICLLRRTWWHGAGTNSTHEGFIAVLQHSHDSQV
jgi:hypothetical protein